MPLRAGVRSNVTASPVSYLSLRLKRATRRYRSDWLCRLTSFNSKDPWHGSSPCRRHRRFESSAMFPAQPTLILRTLAFGSSYYTIAARLAKRWLVFAPLGTSYYTSIGLSPEATLAGGLAVSRLSIRAHDWAWSLLKGLGGLGRLKLRYKGKSFRWHRRRGTLMLRFGHSHLVRLKPLPGIRWRRFGRMKLILFGSNLWDLRTFAARICAWRPMNIYHARGLRLSRQRVYRKAGKVSAYR